jgi:hypothetical protein
MFYNLRHFFYHILPANMKNHQEGNKTRFLIHVDAVYEFPVGEWGVGPVVGFAQSGDDRHYMIGLHLGKGF